jgi:hypothetical protein
MLDALATAIDTLTIGVDGAELTAAIAQRDRLDAKVTLAAAQVDAAELWARDGSVSMAAWLRAHAGQTERQARRMERTGRRLRQLPGVAAAWADGMLSSGHVDAIVATLTDRTTGLFADNEATIVATLARHDVHDAARYVQHWQARALAYLDSLDDTPPEPDPPARRVHLSPTLDGRGRLDGDLDPEAFDLLRTTLRLAESPDLEGEPARTPAQRRADALADVCRYFLDHQHTRPGGRHRPHVNVVIDLADLLAGLPGRALSGLPLDPATVRRLLCDAGIHRVITDGPSSILDYGRATRTIPPAVYTALVLRDHGCRFPGCDRPAEWCEGHHITPWENGGATRLANLALLCSRHHHLIHLRGWHLKLLPHGAIEFTAPDGTTRTSDPPLRC